MQILWIKIDPLHPLDSGGKIRSYNMLREWHKRHEITYASLVEKTISQKYRELASEYSSHQIWCEREDKKQNIFLYVMDLMRSLLFSRQPYIVYKYYNRRFQELIGQAMEEASFDLVIVDFLQVSSNIIHLENDTKRTIIFEHNVENLIWKRHAQQASNFLLKAFMNLQWRRCREYEISACKSLGGVIAVSEDDADYFRKEMGLSNVLGHVSTGVDTDYFCPDSRDPEPNNIVFLGSMDWMANIEGILSFVETSMPIIREKIPDVTLTIVGRNPTEKIRRLGRDSQIRVTGTVDDVRPYLNRASLSIVPLNVGSGTRIKIYELMAAKVPVVSTSIGAEGLPVTHGNNILLADTPEYFAQEVIRLLQDKSLQASISEDAFELVANNFTWEKIINQFEDLCKQSL